MRVNAVIIDNFYDNPDEVREFALKQEYYNPYPTKLWNSSVGVWKPQYVIDRFKEALQVNVDMGGWESNPTPGLPPGSQHLNWKTGKAEYTGRFHVKYANCGMGYHDHWVDNNFNGVGKDGWGCVVFLNPDIIGQETGVFTTIPKSGHAYDYEIDSPPEKKPKMRDGEWPYSGEVFMDDFPDYCKGADCTINHKYYLHDLTVGNVYNRAIAFRGNIWHSGGPGYGDSIENGRMIQTFFFKEKE